MDSSKYRSRGYTMSSSSKRLPYALLLLLALGAAALSAVILHKMRERRIFGLLLQERDHQLISLQILLEKEKAFSKEMRRKVEDLKAKTAVLRTQRTELKYKLAKAETAATHLRNTQKELEADLAEKKSHINQMQEKATDSSHDQVAALTELLKQKEAELEEMKIRFSEFEKGKENTIASESTSVYTSNENTTSGIVVLEKSVNSSDTVPARMEEKNSTNATATDSNRQEEHSTEEQWVKFTTNLEDKTTGDVNASSDDVPGEIHSEKFEVPRRNKKFAHSRNVRRGGQLDGAGQLEEPQDQVTDRNIGSKLLKKEDREAVYVKGTEKEISIDGESENESSKDSISEDTDMADPTDEKLKMNNGNEIKQSNNRLLKKKFRSNKMEMAGVDAVNAEDEEVIKEKELGATANP